MLIPCVNQDDISEMLAELYDNRIAYQEQLKKENK